MKQRYLFAALFSAGVMMPIGFEFGFRKKLHVVKTRPGDWEETDVDLSSFIEEVNKVKEAHIIFQEEAPTEMLHADNSAILLMWKTSTRSSRDALLILNKDIHNKQTFYTEDLHSLVGDGAPLIDISPEYRLDSVNSPFHYDLRPGQGILLINREGGK